MKKINLLIVFFALAIGLFSSCEKSDNDTNPEPKIALDGNAIIINEGAFGKANGSIDIFNEDNGKIYNGYYNKNNARDIAANIQSISLYNGNLYCLTTGGDAIRILDATDHMKEKVNPIKDGIINPRYFVAKGNKAYVSCYGADFYPNYEKSYIAVIDLENNSLITKIERKGGFEDLAIVDDKLYAASINTKEVAVFNIKNNEFVKAISIPDNGRFFVKTLDNNLWVSHSSYIGNDNKGVSLINTKSDAVEKTIKTPRMAANGMIASNTDVSKIFVLGAEAYPSTKTSILLVKTSENKVTDKALIEGEAFYALGYNKKTDKIYVLKSLSYSGAGAVSVYKTDGSIVYSDVTTGIIPRQVIFF